MYTSVILLAFLSVSLGMPADLSEWKEYKAEFEKVYADEKEEQSRYLTWKENVKEILEHNSDNSNSYEKGVNEYTDMTHEEFKQQMGGCLIVPKDVLEGNATSEASIFIPPSNLNVPNDIDWRTTGMVTPVKNQGRCGSCYSFSTTGSLEGQIKKKTGTLYSMSEQQIVDCSRRYGNMGCHGGWMDYSFKYIKYNRGIDSESSYPYYGRQLSYCYFTRSGVVATDTGFTDIRSGDEEALKSAVATIGPISVAIDARHSSMKSYRSGVYIERNCGSGLRSLDHAVLVVGYGTEGGQDYWLVKNSWGTRWGDSGYIKMARNYQNQCGIATKASYPLV